MIIDIFNEVLWLNFQKLEHIKDLPLREQTIQYNGYLSELEAQRMAYYNWLNENVYKGDSFAGSTNDGFLLQENLFYISQENGAELLITDPNSIIK